MQVPAVSRRILQSERPLADSSVMSDFEPTSPWHRQTPRRDRTEAWGEFWDVMTTAIARAIASGDIATETERTEAA